MGCSQISLSDQGCEVCVGVEKVCEVHEEKVCEVCELEGQVLGVRCVTRREGCVKERCMKCVDRMVRCVKCLNRKDRCVRVCGCVCVVRVPSV